MHRKPGRAGPSLDQAVRHLRRQKHPVAPTEIEPFTPNFEYRATFEDQDPFVV